MAAQIRHLFFDLDHTLWDFETNSNATLAELYDEHQLHRWERFDLDAFMKVYRNVNHGLWDAYNRNQVTKEDMRERRFRETFCQLGLEDDCHPVGFSDQYISRCTLKQAVFPDTHEVLQALRQRFSMSIISNGFPESQHRKMTSSQLHPYFSHLIFSEEIGYAKPHPGIFEAALEKAQVKKEEVVMIGDNLYADVGGAQAAGIKAIWFNPERQENPDPSVTEIHSLKDLLGLI